MKILFSTLFTFLISLSVLAQSSAQGKFECNATIEQRGDGLYIKLESKPIIFDSAPSDYVALSEKDFKVVKDDGIESNGSKLIQDPKRTNLEFIKANISVSTMVTNENKAYGFLAVGKLAVVQDGQEYELSQTYSQNGLLQQFGNTSNVLLRLNAEQVDIRGSIYCEYKTK